MTQRQINETIDWEIKGFEKAMELLNSPARIGWSKEQVIQFAEMVQCKHRISQFGMGFMDAARIIARTHTKGKIMVFILRSDITSPDSGVIANAGEYVIELERDENGIMVETMDRRVSFYVDESEIDTQLPPLEQLEEDVKNWPVTDNETGIQYKNLREFAEKTGKVSLS